MRLEALAGYGILDTESEAAYDRIVDLARILFDAPIALVSFVDSARQWFKARSGLDVSETSREHAFCDHAIRSAGVLVVPDARVDPRFAANPLVTGAPRIRFYAGAPLTTSAGVRLGTVCIISPEPRPSVSERDQKRLQVLARIAVNELELRRKAEEALDLARDKEVLSQEIEHRVRSNLRLVTHVLQNQAQRSPDRPVRRALFQTADRLAGMEALHHQLRQPDAVFDQDARAYLLALIGNLQDAFADEADGRTISLAVGPMPALPPDRMARLGMVATELITNALRHGFGAVQVIVGTQDGEIVLSVADDGPGLQATHRPLLAPERLGLRVVATLALPDGIAIDPACDRRIMVRMAGVDQAAAPAA